MDAGPDARNTPSMLSRRSRYALRALIHLAQREAEGPASIAEIARLASAPRKFLEAILLDLRNLRGAEARRAISAMEAGPSSSRWARWMRARRA